MAAKLTLGSPSASKSSSSPTSSTRRSRRPSSAAKRMPLDPDRTELEEHRPTAAVPRRTVLELELEDTDQQEEQDMAPIPLRPIATVVDGVATMALRRLD